MARRKAYPSGRFTGQYRGKVVGNLAYQEQSLPYPETQQPRKVYRRKKYRKSAAARFKLREAQGIDFRVPLGAVAIAASALMLIGSYATLTRISADTVSMQAELDALKAEHVELVTQYEKTFDMATVQAAADRANMQRLRDSQIHYIELSEAEETTVYTQNGENLMDRLSTDGKNIFSQLLEFFR